MILFKCKECDLLTSENLFTCPKCKSDKVKKAVDTYTMEQEVYVLTLEDFDFVLKENYTVEVSDYISKTYSREFIAELLRSKLEINYQGYIKSIIDTKLLSKFNQ